jgi:uncharacterized protein
MADAVEVAVRFGRALREEGLAVGSDRLAGFCRAASLLDPEDLYWAGRATLVASPVQLPVYDRVFADFFGAGEAQAPGGAIRVRVEGPLPREGELALASSVELLRDKRFSDCSEDELAQLAAVMAELRPVVPLRRSRRRLPARSGSPDLRRTLRRAFRNGGDPVRLHWRARRRRPRRLVFILDVSGSMSDYSRALLLFAHAAVRGQGRWEAFCFGTRLTRLTRPLAGADPDEALRRAAEEVVDWNGGTRIGESLHRFLADYGHRGLARGAVVVICSDGLEVGDPALLEHEMAHLARLAHRVIWLNPLRDDPAYEPLARGMRAALPHVDVFLSGARVSSLETLADELARI